MLLRIFLAVALALAPVKAFAGDMKLLGAGGPAAAGYTGTGDTIASGWITWYGLYAFSAADRGNKLIQLCDAVTAGNCTDMFSSATTGLLVLTLVNGVTDCTISTCYAGKWYDRSAGSCTGVCDFTFTGGSRPVFVSSCIGSRPCLKANGANNAGNTISTTATPPFSLTVVTKIIGTGTRQCVFGTSAGNLRMGGAATSGNDYMFSGGSVQTNAASDSAFHAFSGMFNGASSKISVDGSSATTAASPGTNNWQSLQSINIFGCGDTPTTNDAFLTEAGANNTDISANFSALSTTQKANAGF